MYGNAGAGVGVRRCRRIGGEGDLHPEDRFVGRVEEFVFVEEFDDWGWAATGASWSIL